MARVGDYSNKQYLYKIYKRGYSSLKPKYIDTASGQYIDTTLTVTSYGGLSQGIVAKFGDFGARLDTTGSGGSQAGTVTSDSKRMIDITGVIATFKRDHDATGGTVNSYYAQLFGYKVVFDPVNTQARLYKDGVLVSTQTLSSSYDYIRIYESSGNLYIDSSSNGTTWTNWSSYTINYSTDVVESQLVFGFDLSAAGATTIFARLTNVLVTDRAGQLLAIEKDKVLDDLQFTTNINTPAASTTIKMNYSPTEIPDYIEVGNNVEVYANFYDWSSSSQYEPILDEDGLPILDQNSQPIYGKVLNSGEPDNLNNQRFSGYIETIDYDYDENTITLTVVSHGELLANTLVYEADSTNSVLSQLLDNVSLSTSTTQYQTIKLYKQTKIDELAFKYSSASGGSVQYEITTTSGTQLGSTYPISWSGSLASGVYQFPLINSVILEPGTYRIRITPLSTTISIRYQNTNVYPDGGWSGGAGDMYFNVYTTLPDYAVTLEGTSSDIVDDAYSFLDENYTLTYKGDVDVSDFTVAIQSNIDDVNSLIDNLQNQMDTGWWWHIDPGTGEFRLKAPSTEPDHILVLGRDLIGFHLTKSIGNIKNHGIFTGGEVAANVNLAVEQTDSESIGRYKYGLSIESNEKVTRYDSAGLLVNNTIQNNNMPRFTTDIVVSASLYDIETFRIGHMVRVVNDKGDVLGDSLVVASIQYNPKQVTLSLDTAPANINRRVDAIRRQLQNEATANAGGII